MPSIADRLLHHGFTVRRLHTGETVTFRGIVLSVTIDRSPLAAAPSDRPDFTVRQQSNVEVDSDDVDAPPRPGETFTSDAYNQSHRIKAVKRRGDHFLCECEVVS